MKKSAVIFFYKKVVKNGYLFFRGGAGAVINGWGS